ncbi:E3 ubiquitin-protein ligase HUWE1 isoform X1 [Neodiprion pinetum]|uniref:E3 ubiquitin-protein ligase HUWE1 isoform X1 n=1 Tax=Neodiprion pinetum TaxID=441929 RepID=UPI001EDFCCB5|nr:E3 ubiquitin-protein ligase HUWE1 isoform X1 [Neodiprion pinetum]XP_046484253.1 E3 ubiquitin-protein ligase HUWE1 isoform X1 [Neodiprion pinetum]XP_046484254.1 E3 ubiquitin-protein ligase HUWE1 isoform X1 [Neodiprion pinetum]
MKIDRCRLKKCTSEVPAECQALISKLRSCSHAELLEELKQIDAWTFGKCELFHWIDVLDLSDSILEEAAARSPDNQWELACDLPQNREAKELLLWVLHFTTLLIEHSFSRHLYNSMEHLVTLLSSCDMHVVLGVLNLLYMFSKRSNFITRLNSDKRQALLSRLNHLAESWGGKENGFGLADCCKEQPEKPFPASATTLHFEFYAENPIVFTTTSATTTATTTTTTTTMATEPAMSSSGSASGGSSNKKSGQTNLVTYIHIEGVDKLRKTPAQIMNDLLKSYNVPQERQMALLTHIRLAHSFSDYRRRLQCVQARLQALSVLVYSNALQENAHSLLHAGLLEELVELLELPHAHLVEIRAAALRTLTSIIHLDRNPHFPKKPGSRLNMIIDVTGASSYHGFLPVLVRTCISTLTSPQPDGQPFPLPLATALFSFLYHLASYEAGGEALVSCGMMESLLKVINWPGSELEHITFVTRAVRVIDLITNIDMQGFQAHGGLVSFINRLDMEVNVCRKEQPFEIEPQQQSNQENQQQQQQSPADRPAEVDDDSNPPTAPQMNETFDDREESLNLMEFSEDENAASKVEDKREPLPDYSGAKTGKTCLPQRAALLKSMLNFLKKAIQDPAFTDSIRHVMEGTLPASLKHIISNSDYYGPSLFLLATDVVTVYVFQEPSLLSSLQDNGLTDVVLHALLIKDVPATREVLGSLPNVFSALCLNQRGLESFVKCRPFERLFKVLLSPVYLSAMRRRRSADPLGDTASNLGNAMDELMRHQPSLKVDATAAIIKLLEELCLLGCDPRYVCWRAASKSENSPSSSSSSNRQSSGQSVGVGVGDGSGGAGGGGGSSSDEEDEDEEEASTSSHPQREEQPSPSPAQPGPPPQPREKTPIALVDYIHNVMKFVDAILSNNSTDDHCREFVAQKGLVPLLSILGLPNLPVDYPVAQAAQAVASVCKSILNLAHEPLVLKTGLSQLNEVLNLLKPLHCHMESPGGSVLLHELASAPNLETAFTSDQATPLLHAMNAAHGYVVMFVHVCRTGQSEIRNLSMNHWGSDLGLTVLKGLSELYTSLVWESTLLLALCSDDIIPAGCDFGKEDMDKLVPLELRTEGEPSSSWAATTSSDMGSNGMTTAMEALSTDPPPVSMEVIKTQELIALRVDDKPSSVTGRTSPSTHQLKYIKPLLGASSRLGRALAELFGLLVKLCVGSPIRQRRGQQLPMTPSLPSQAARSVAKALNGLLTRGLSWDKLPPSPIPKFRLTFLICSVGFTSPMLFDEKRHPYHLMLQTFVHSGGQAAFFATFHWALSGGGQFPLSEGLEHPNLPDGTGEFLDAWLMLLEKMVNPKAILDSPHAVSSKNIGVYRVYETFDPIKYLTDIHKKAFEAVMLMWGKKPLKNYGARMTESILSILRHILRGEKIIKERAEKEEGVESTSTAAGTTGASSSVNTVTASTTERREEPEADVNPQHLRQLMDMGFSRAHCIEALLHTLNVEQATDYLLTNPATLRRTDAPAGDASGQGLIMDLELVDDDQIMHAIAMSLGDTDPRKYVGPEEPVKESSPSKSIDEFTHSTLEQCLNLLDLMPDTVYRICDLLVTITKRNGDEWRDGTLRQLIREIADLVDFLIDIAENGGENNGTRLIECEEASKVAGRIYLYTLFFEGPFQEMRVPCAQIVAECGITEKLVKLLVVSEGPLTESKSNKNSKENKDAAAANIKTPKWLAPLLLLIDRLEKVAVLTQRKQLMHKVTNRTWKWFDLSTGKWTPYSSINNRAINDAYRAGESNVRITCGRRRYLITFSCMTQVNEDSDNRRPITMEFKLKNSTGEDGNPTTESNMDTEGCPSPAISPEEDKRNAVVQGLDPAVAPNIVRACVKLLAIPVDRDALHALMKVCLRLTRDYRNAEVFAREGGVKLLLDMTQGSSFIGCISLSTLLIRHTLEEPRTLCLAMEKVVRARTLTNIPPAYKEILYMTRQISSAVCRNPEVYREVCENILRVDINVLKRDDVDNRLLVKALPPTHSPAMPMVEEVSVGVIQDLLNALIKPMPVIADEAMSSTPIGSPEKKTTPHSTSSSTSVASTSRRDILRNSSATPANCDALDDDDQVSQLTPLKIYADISNNGKVEPEEAKKPLLPKSAILKMLAEAVRSYGAVANLITEHTYRAGQSELVVEDTTALAFLLDKLLPMLPENTCDRQCSSMARMLIAALASCNHSPDAQTTLVTEVKAALTRSLALPESSEKHAQLQLLIGLISTMIDNCPPTAHTHLRASLKLSQYSNVNNIVRIMLKKGIVTDLAKIPHSLDLSSPNMAGTINAALKPLETLSRIINQPMPGAVSSKFSKPKNNRNAQEETGIGEQTGTTNSEATHAVGEEPNEDAENTEHDISVTAESLEPTSESHVHEEGDEAALDDIMDQLLESVLFPRDGSAITEEPPSRPHRPMDIDEESLAMREAEGEFDPARDTTEDLMSSDSDSDSNPSDDNEDEVQDDDDDEEEEEDDAEENEEEEEEEEEGSSNYEEDGMEFYDDVGEGVFRMLPSADRDSGNVVMIQHSYDNHDNGSSTPASTGPSLPWNTNFPLPFGIFDDPTAVESNGINSHPLLMARNNLEAASLPASRAQRTLRQRRYQYLQLANPRNTNPPVILQRLLGPTAQTLPLATSQVLASNFRDTRVVVMDNGLGIFTNQEEEQIDFVDQAGYLFGPGLAATLNNIPTALHWWIEESKLLDGDSQPDCCVGVVQKLIPGLEKYRNIELAERKEKRKKHNTGDKESEKEEKSEKEQPSNTESEGATTTVATDEQITSASTSTLREDTRQLVAAVEAAVEAVDDIIENSLPYSEVTGEMEVTVQEDEDRAPPTPQAEQRSSEVRDPRTVTRNATLELAESIVDSVLRPSASEATRLQRQNIRNPEDLSPINLRNRGATPILVDFNQEVYHDLPTDIESSGNPTDWIRRLLTDETQLNVERNANVVSQGPSSSSAENNPQESENQQPPQQQEQQLPDGVDPSFLAALPEDMREEVIAEQLRLQRIRQRAQATVVEEPTGPVEVNPEFLAALPPAIQEEVLAQQRLEQQRHAAASANPEDPVDAAAFFQNLQPSLRQAILTDMEESQISVLPPDLAQEAQSLRRDWEARNRRMMQERILSHVTQSNPALSSILRNSGRGRGGGARYAIHTVPQRSQWSSWNPRGEGGINHQGAGLRLRGRQLLDHESMACLLVLLFVDEPKINTLRLHRVIRNLCYHGSTREWVVRALLSIMERSNDENKDAAADFGGKFKRKGLYPMIDFGLPKVAETRNSAQSWLNISMDAALGCRANVFHITRHGGKRSERQCNVIAIHPQAAPTVCRHTLELLISLAKSFPGYFVPLKSKEAEEKEKEKESKENKEKEKETNIVKDETGTKAKSTSKPGKSDLPDFWDMLLRLDSCASKKGKSVARTHSYSNLGSEPEQSTTSFEVSAFGQLISMLNWSVVKRSSQLTDKLLRLLSLISIGLTEVNPYRRQEGAKNKKVDVGKEQSVAAPEGHLRLAVQVLTSKSCSEEGLEDATALLLNLSHCPDPTRQLILKLLLEGAMELANMVCEHINDLMMELKVLNREINRRYSIEEQPSTSSGSGGRGILHDRFTNDNVIVTAPSKVKAGSDLQLPSMGALVSKTSSQAFFLRILKVIVQIREAVRLAHKKKTEVSQTAETAMDTGTTSQQPPVAVAEEYVEAVAMDTTQPNVSNTETPKASIGSTEPLASTARDEEDKSILPLLSESLVLDNLWETLSACLLELEHTPDHHAVLVLQPAVEAFFLVHSSSSTPTRERNNDTTTEARDVVPDLAPVSPIYSDNEGTSQPEAVISSSWDMAPAPQVTLPSDQLKFLKFAETHRTVLNQILRQTTTHLADGPFSVLVDHTRVLDFDVKRRYFRTELERMDEGIRREELAVHVRRSHIFEDSFRELHRRNADEWKNRFYIVFEGEEGQDAGGLLREWYVIISREIFNPMYALFTVSPGDRVTYMINSSSHCNPNHLCYYKFVGRVIAKAIYDNKLLECYFTRSFYKHILGILVKHTDMESEDYSFYKGLVYLTEHNVSDLGYELTFSAEVNEFGVNDVRDLIPNGRNIVVTEETKLEYIRLVCQMKMTGAIRKQLNAFLEGFYDIIPKRLISIFNEQELELLISGLPNVDIEDLKSNTEYHKYSPTSLQIQWFWRALRGFDQADRAKFLQFVTGTSKVPLQGFGALEGMNGVQKFQIHRDDRSTDRLPSAHTCFNQLDLPVYETYDKLRSNLLKAIHECSEGFGFA